MNLSNNPNKRMITIFDTTLRDGEQSPGASMNLPEKLEVARALEELGVDVIEAGFPIVSQGDFESVREVARIIRKASVCGLARCVDADIDAAWDALRYAEHPRIHIFLATSAIHREHKLRMTQEQIIERAVAGVRRGRNYCEDIEFSPEDASRTEIDFLCKVVEAVIDAGATTVNIPDTVGYATPLEMQARIATLIDRVPNIDKAILSVHCHNDLGMAVSNSLAAVMAGAGQIECTINGLGERAGNSALEEVVMAMRTRGDVFKADTRIVSQRLVPTSRLVSQITGLKVPRNKAIVGQNAFAHEAGIHQDGVLKDRTTYEIMVPESVGFTKSDLVLGKHSGRAALADRAKQLGHELTTEQLTTVFTEFKKLADRKKEIYDADILALIEQQIHEKKAQTTVDSAWKYEGYSLICSDGQSPRISVTLSREGQKTTFESHKGGGPVAAVFSAVVSIVNLPLKLREFKVEAVTGGPDAQGEVVVLVEREENVTSVCRGHGISTDIIEATIMALLNAINRMIQVSP
ncbi:MAG: 2-isopropylmalate synthase [Planctomycetia bacterium]|nr:2-isopropylmalate synthase [Planctomycetia bacterium]